MARRRAAQDSNRPGRLALLLATLALGLLATACSAPRETTDLPDDPADALGELAWLAGDWRRLDSASPQGERWWQDGQQLIGEGWIQDGPRRLLAERMTIRVDEDRLVYEVRLPGREETPTLFELTELGRRAVAFENRPHRSPWRLAYVDGPAGMEVSVFFRDGPGEGSSRVERMRFVRVRD